MWRLFVYGGIKNGHACYLLPLRLDPIRDIREYFDDVTNDGVCVKNLFQGSHGKWELFIFV